MCNTHSFYRLYATLSQEHRLIHDTPRTETSPETARDGEPQATTAAPNVMLQQLKIKIDEQRANGKDDVDAIDEGSRVMLATASAAERGNVIRATMQIVEEKKQEILAQTRNDADRRMAELKIRTLDAIGQKRQQEVAAHEATAEEKPQAPRTSPTTRTENPAQQEIWYNPSTWSKQTADRAKTIAIVGGVVVGTMLAWKAFQSWFGEKATAAKEKASDVWQMMKVVLGVGAATAAGVILWETLKRWGMDTLKQQLETERAKLLAAAGREKDILEQNIRRIETELRRRGETVASVVAPRAAEMTSKAKKTITEVGNSAEAKNVRHKLFAKGLVRFSETEDWEDVPESAKVNQVTDIINMCTQRNLTMKTLCMGIDGTAIDHTRIPGFELRGDDLPSRQKAARFLLKFCGNHRGALENTLKRKGLNDAEVTARIDAMSLEQYLEESAASYAASMPIVDAISEANGDIATAVKNLNMEALSAQGSAFQQEVRRFAQQYKEELKLTDIDIDSLTTADILKAFGDVAGGTVNGASLSPNAPEASKRILWKLYEDIKNGNTQKFMLPFFHGVFPDRDAATDPRENEKTVKTYLLDHMDPHQALRFYFYGRMIQNGNPSGVVLMQAEILRYIMSNDLSWDQHKKTLAAQRIAETMLTKSAEEIAEEYKRLGIEVDAKMFAKSWEVLKAMLAIGMKIGAGSMMAGTREGWNVFRSLMTDHPVLTTGGAATATVGSIELARARFRASTLPDKIKSRLSTSYNRSSFNNGAVNSMRNALRSRFLGINPNDIQGASHAFTKIYDAVEGLPAASSLAQTELKQALEQCARSSGSLDAWENFRNVATKHRKAAIAAHADTFVRSAGMRRAFELAQHPRLNWIPGARGIVNLLGKLRNQIVVPAIKAPVTHVPAGLGGKTLVAVPAIATAVRAYDVFRRKVPALQKELAQERDDHRRAQIQREIDAQRVALAGDAGATALMYRLPRIGLRFGRVAGTTLGAAVEGGMWARGEMEEEVTYLHTTQQQLEQRSPGAMLAHVQRTSPDDLTFGAAFAAGSAVGAALDGQKTMNETFLNADTAARSEGYAAYFRHGAQLPDIPDTLLTPQEKANTALGQKRLQVLSDEQRNQYTQGALTYIAHVTKGRFGAVDAQLLQRAELHGSLVAQQWMDWQVGKKNTFGKKTWEEREQDIDTELEADLGCTLLQIDEAVDNGIPLAEALTQALLQASRDSLALCEGKILGTNYSQYLSIASWAHWSSEEDMQILARAQFAEIIRRTLQDTVANPTLPVTDVRFKEMQQRIVSALKQDPNTLAKEGLRAANASDLRAVGRNPLLLTPEGIAYLRTQKSLSQKQAA